MKLNELKTKFKNGVKKHWKKGLVIVTVGGGIFYAGYKMGGKGKMDFPKGNFFMANWPKDEKVSIEDFIQDFKIGEFNNMKDLEIPHEFVTAHIDELWKEDDDVLAIMHDIDIHDLGKFGEEVREKIPELKDKDFVHFPCIGFTKFNAD